MFEWNKPFQLVMKIKKDYTENFGLDTYNFETWLSKLNKPEYNNVLECLQVNQDKEFLLIRYGLAEMQEGMWTDKNSIYRECRSVVIDLKNEQLVLTPFRKFFNLNEVEENQFEVVIEEMKNAKSIEFTDKLDGSMQSARWYNNKIFMTGSMAINPDKSWRLADGYKKLTNQHRIMIKENPEYTFIFEYINLKDAHVVLYNKQDEGMYLIGIRNVYTGYELTYKEIKEYSLKYSIPMAQIENITIHEAMKKAKEYKSNEKEGWILNIDGHKIKIKCDDYVHLHRLLDKVSSVNVIIKNIADNKYDDMMSKIPDSYKSRVEKIAKIIVDYKNNTEKLINEYFEKAPKTDKKTFMIWVTENCPNEIKGYIRSKYLDMNVNVLKSYAGSYKKIKEIGNYQTYSALFTDLED